MTCDTIKTGDCTNATVVITVGPCDSSDCWECPPLPRGVCIDWHPSRFFIDPSPYLWPTYGLIGYTVPVIIYEPSGHRPRQLESTYG